jgi:hypothetical protein
MVLSLNLRELITPQVRILHPPYRLKLTALLSRALRTAGCLLGSNSMAESHPLKVVVPSSSLGSPLFYASIRQEVERLVLKTGGLRVRGSLLAHAVTRRQVMVCNYVQTIPGTLRCSRCGELAEPDGCPCGLWVREPDRVRVDMDEFFKYAEEMCKRAEAELYKKQELPKP